MLLPAENCTARMKPRSHVSKSSWSCRIRLVESVTLTVIYICDSNLNGIVTEEECRLGFLLFDVSEKVDISELRKLGIPVLNYFYFGQI